MFCIKCGQFDTQVINSRKHRNTPIVWRRRRCKQCNHTFTTYETIGLDQLKVQRKNKTEDFSHTRLLISIAACFEHVPQKRAELTEALVQTIEVKLLKQGHNTSPSAICAVSYDVLKHFDHLASVQYAAKHPSFLKKRLA